jgi:DNA-3-methyladenine glycosylase II
MALGESDPVLGALQRAHPGQRPVLFTSPYEAAEWAVISARRPPVQAAGVREDLCRQFGESFELAGVTTLAFPQPEHLAQLGDQFPGLNLEKLVRLRNVVAAALAGELDIARLHELGPAQACTEIQKLRGLGPFYAGLVVLRASGFADAPLLAPEPKVLRNLARFYGLAEPPPLFEQYLATAESWRPFRTWATVLIRLAGDRGTQLPEGL